ncbi:uncharacterized protein [Palaemon carinicauda]|uniref:uncharacterized protein n=1 Tax=Palaemon carinicauda TaxID=392227 RepID=UPI0035B5BB7B
MPTPGFEDTTEVRRKGKFLDKRNHGHYTKNRKLRSFNHNHGFHRQRQVPDQPPFIPHRPPESDYYMPPGPTNCQRPPDHDRYLGHPPHELYGDRHGPDMYPHHLGYNMHNGPPLPGIHGGPPLPDMHNRPLMSDMHNGPPMHDMHNGPPMPDMHNGPTLHDMHNGPPMPDIRNGPPISDMHNRPLMHDICNMPPVPNMPNGPMPCRDIYRGPPHRDIHDGPVDSDRFLSPACSDYHHGLRKPEIFNGPIGPDRYHRSPDVGMQGPHGAEMHFRSHGPDNHYGLQGSESRDDVYHRLPAPDMDCVPHSDNFCAPPGPVLCNGLQSGDRYGRPGGYENHHGLPGNEIHHAPNRGDICHRPNGPSNLEPHPSLSPMGSEICHEPQGRDISSSSKTPSLSNNPPIHEYSSGHSHQSPLYPGLHLHHTPPLVVPPPFIPVIPMQVSSVLSYPPIEPSYPPLPQTPPSNERPPPPPSPCPPSPRPPSPRPPSPRLLPPRPPSPTSPPPLSPAEKASATVRDEPYDPAEALFSPASNSDSPEITDKQKESIIINKYVKHVEKLKLSDNNVQAGKPSETTVALTKKIDRNVKMVKTSQEPSKIECGPVKKSEESPARPSLDARLKLMFGATSEKESPKREKKRESPKVRQDTKGDIKELCRPLSPPPSPFRSKQMYLYWHNVTMKMRKSSKAISNNFVNSKTHPGIKDVKSERSKNSLKPSSLSEPFQKPLPPKKALPTVPSSNSKTKKTMLSESHHRTDLVHKNSDRPHPYKLAGSKDCVVQHSLDSEFELTCEGSLHENDNEMDLLHENIQEAGESESCSENKTVSIVLSKILEELKNEIRMQLTNEIIDKRINSLIDTPKL